MPTKTFRLEHGLDELRKVFQDILLEGGFITLSEENFGDGFHILAVNKKRLSLMQTSFMSLIGGYIPRKRIGLELSASGGEESITAVLKCIPYMDTIDIETTLDSKQDHEKYSDLLEFFADKILQRLGGS